MAQRTKADLARRLGVHESDLISRAEAALILGLTEGTLRTKANLHVGFFKLADSRSSPAIYPKPWVEEYKLWLDGPRSSSFSSEKSGSRGWPPLPKIREISLNEAVMMMDRWRYRELHLRCEAMFQGDESRLAALTNHQREARLLFDRSGGRRSESEADLAGALERKVRELIEPAGTASDPQKLMRLMKIVWESVLETERGWLSRIAI
jgi:hypothetical protein